jgi:poly-gamma-glutamate capsule biosynthesis protein CapA/YwtB (metallophosphatase superfamily)
MPSEKSMIKLIYLMNKQGINLLITGDFCPSHRIANLIEKEEYSKIYNDFLPLIHEVDLAITNLECPLIDHGKKIEKTGPNLNATIKSVEALKYGGFNLVSLANNHIMDYGVTGLNSTIETCKRLGIECIGVGSNLRDAREPLYKEIKGIRIALINFCENEWSTTSGKTPGANPLNPVSNYYDIKQAREKADHVIVIVHGGHEYYQLPSPRMQETYRFFADAGASAVIGHHTHCFSGYEIYHDTPIFYSLGNFIFDWPGNRGSVWNKGYAVLFQIHPNRIEFTLHPFVQGDQKPGVRLMNEPEKIIFEEQLTILNIQIGDSKKIESQFKEFLHSRKRYYLSCLEPYSNKYLLGLYDRGLLPSFVSGLKRRIILNIVRCEAHRDMLIKTLND